MTYKRLITKFLRTIKDLRAVVKATVVRMHQNSALIFTKKIKKIQEPGICRAGFWVESQAHGMGV